MFRLWLTLRRIRQRATPRPAERAGMLAYLRKAGALNGVSKQSVYTFARMFTAVATLVVIVCVSLSSYAYASDAVLPDTVLYPVRQAIEEVEVKLAVTPVQKQKAVQKLVERRKKEVKILEEKKRPVPVKLKKFLQTATTATTTPALRTQQKRPRVLENIKRLERLRDDKPVTTSTRVLFATSTRYARPSVEERKEAREQLRQKQEDIQKAKRLERQQQLKQRQEAARQKRLLQQRLRERQREQR